MPVELPVGPHWVHEDVGAVRVYTVPGFALVPDFFFEVGPILARTEIEVDPILMHDLAPDLEVRRAPVATTETRNGWPVTLHEAAFFERGELRELRLLARYEMLVLGTFVLARATNAQRFEQHRADIRELIETVRIDLASDEPAAIAELWDVGPRSSG